MNISLLWKYLLLYNLFCFHLVKNELIFVYENSRHGIRGSITENESSVTKEGYIDEYKSHWEGNGELTEKGKMQQYILGIRNRLKYPKLLNYSKFNSEEILVYSTNTSRAKESAYNQLLGMYNPLIISSEKNNLYESIPDSNKFYYPPNYNLWKFNSNHIYVDIMNEAELSIKEYLKNKKSNNNSTKLFLTEGKFDLNNNNKKYKLNFEFKPYKDNRTFFLIFKCKNNRKYVKYRHKNEFKEVLKENFEKKYGDKLQSFFGYEKKEWLYKTRNAVIIIDNFIANYYNDRNLTEFFESTKIDKEEYYEKCINVYKWWIYHLFCDEKTCILESQKMMEDLIEYMDNKINDKQNKLKMVINLGHDFTIAPMEIFMHETFGTKYTTTLFSTNIYFELHKENDDYFVKYYIDGLLSLNIKYGLFKEKVFSKFWSEKEKDDFCNGNIFKVLYPKTFLFCEFFIISILIGIIILIFYRRYMKHSNKRKEKSILQNKNKSQTYREDDGNEKELELI